jgi:hypothetical protein
MSKITSGLTTHQISADETGNSTKVLLTSSATYTGAWEDVTAFATVAVAIKGDNPTDGILYIESSQDGGTTVNSVPFVIDDASFDLPHIWNGVESHIRIRYVNGTTAQTGHFQLQTKYSNAQQLGLLQEAGQIINEHTNVQLMKSIIAGETLDGNLESTGLYNNVSLLANKALKTAIPPTVLFQYIRPVDPVIPSGAAITIDPVLNVEANVYDSGWIASSSYGGGSLVNIISDVNLSVYVMNASDDQGNNIQGEGVPTLNAIGGFSATVGAAFFDLYFRVVCVNTSGTTANEYSLRATGNQTAVPAVVTSIEQPVLGFYPAPITRGVAVAKNPDGTYINAPASGTADAMSTNTPLGIAGVFTTPWCPVEAFGEIKIAMVTDELVNTCLLQLSHDGVTIDTSLSLPPQPIGLTGNYGFIHSLNPSLPYFRIVYTNGAVAQTLFKLTTTLLVASGNGFVGRATAVLDRYTDVKTSRVVNDPVDDRNFGLVNYQSQGRKFGHNDEVGNAAFETLWSYTADWIPAQSAETIRIKAGGDAADDTAGAGAQTVEVTFLNGSWDEVTETIVTAGALASASTSATCIRVLRAIVINVGAYHGRNTGAITIEQTTSGAIMGYIEAEAGSTEQAIMSVPQGKTLYITNILISVGQADSADIRIQHVPAANDVTTPFRAGYVEWEVEDFSGAQAFKPNTYLKFDEYADIYCEAQRITGSGTARVSIDFDYILIDN